MLKLLKIFVVALLIVPLVAAVADAHPWQPFRSGSTAANTTQAPLPHIDFVTDEAAVLFVRAREPCLVTVAYGTTLDFTMLASDGGLFEAEHTIVLTNLTAVTTYFFQATFAAPNGTVSKSAVIYFRTMAGPTGR